MSTTKKFLYVNRKAPYGTIYAQESLEVVFIGAAFEQEVALLFIDDGVFQLKKDQNTEDSDLKNFSATYKALGDYDINKIYVSADSLKERGLIEADLYELTWEDEDEDWAEKNSIHILSSDEIKEMTESQDVILSF